MIIFRYISKEISLTTLAILVIFLVIFIGPQCALFLNDVIEGQLDPNLLGKIFVLLAIAMLPLLLPLSFWIAILLTYGRLYAENEMTVLFVCGMVRTKLVFYTLIIALFVSAIIAYLAFIVSPDMMLYKSKLVADTAEKNIILTVVPGRFQATNGGKKVFYVESIARDKTYLENIFLAEQGGGQTNFLQKSEKNSDVSSQNEWSIILANVGTQEDKPEMGGRFLSVKEGERYTGGAGEKNLLLVKYETYGVRLPAIENVSNSPTSMEEWSTRSLVENYFSNNHAAAELQWRISLPLQIFILAWLAVPLSRTVPRQGRYAPLFPAMAIYALYANALFLARNFIDKGLINIFIGLWWVHLILILLGVYLYWGQPGWHPIHKFNYFRTRTS